MEPGLYQLTPTPSFSILDLAFGHSIGLGASRGRRRVRNTGLVRSLLQLWRIVTVERFDDIIGALPELQRLAGVLLTASSCGSKHKEICPEVKENASRLGSRKRKQEGINR